MSQEQQALPGYCFRNLTLKPETVVEHFMVDPRLVYFQAKCVQD